MKPIPKPETRNHDDTRLPAPDVVDKFRETRNEKRETGNEKREMRNEKRETGNAKRETGNEKRETIFFLYINNGIQG